jgi:Rhodopirellula transposase DDE domain
VPHSVWMIDPDVIRARFASLSPHLDERSRRLFAASEARAAGYGGVAAVSRATGIAASTIGRGLAQFAYINQSVTAALAAQQPVISVDTKKKGVLQRHGKGFDMN